VGGGGVGGGGVGGGVVGGGVVGGGVGRPPVVVGDTRTAIPDLLLDQADERVKWPHIDGRLGVRPRAEVAGAPIPRRLRDVTIGQ